MFELSVWPVSSSPAGAGRRSATAGRSWSPPRSPRPFLWRPFSMRLRPTPGLALPMPVPSVPGTQAARSENRRSPRCRHARSPSGPACTATFPAIRSVSGRRSRRSRASRGRRSPLRRLLRRRRLPPREGPFHPAPRRRCLVSALAARERRHLRLRPRSLHPKEPGRRLYPPLLDAPLNGKQVSWASRDRQTGSKQAFWASRDRQGGCEQAFWPSHDRQIGREQVSWPS